MEVWNPNVPAFSQNFWFESMITDINTAVAMKLSYIDVVPVALLYEIYDLFSFPAPGDIHHTGYSIILILIKNFV